MEVDAFAKRSQLREPRLRTFTVLNWLLMPSAGIVFEPSHEGSSTMTQRTGPRT